MFRTGFLILRLLLVLVLLAGVVGAVAMAFRAGYSQGYVLGAAADGDAPRDGPGYWMAPGMVPYAHPRFFPPFGLFFCGGLFFLFLLVAIFRPHHWHRHPAWAAHGPAGRHAHWHGHPWWAEHAAHDPAHGQHAGQPGENKPEEPPSQDDSR
ncbi:MAG: hypothetical protein ACOYYS_13535 [Chloroflexota bacterium]